MYMFSRPEGELPRLSTVPAIKAGSNSKLGNRWYDLIDLGAGQVALGNKTIEEIGYSHPGIVEMLKEIKSTFKKSLYWVLGGFHLLHKSEKEMQTVIAEMKAPGVVKCGASRCTRIQQIKMFNMKVSGFLQLKLKIPAV
jgi:metal-dependent hydrolase (beta-lactamase superfamily II)